MSSTLRSGAATKRRRGDRAGAAARVDAALANPGLQTASLSIDAREYELVSASELPRRRRQPGQIKPPRGVMFNVALSLPGGKKLFQKPGLPPSAIPGQSATQALFSDAVSGARRNPALDDDDDAGASAAGEDWDREHGFYVPVTAESNASRHRRRRIAQNVRWRQLASVQLPKLYLHYKHGVAEEQTSACHCPRTRDLKVMYADWQGAHTSTLVICECRPAVRQLIAQGYFPCAPLAPSMAFSLDLLHFISIHSLLVAPNVTAWAESLEAFWSRNKAQDRITGRLRKRLGTALTWYQVMCNKADVIVALELKNHSTATDNVKSVPETARSSKRTRTDDLHPRADEPPLKRARQGHDAEPYADDASSYADNTCARGAPPSTRSGNQGSRADGQGERAAVPSARSGDQRGRADGQGERAAVPSARSGDQRGRADGHDQRAAAPSVSADGQGANADGQGVRAAAQSARSGGHGERTGAPSAADTQAGSKSRKPSAALRQKCPLCFGADKPVLQHSRAHVLVCLDACFAHKRRKCAGADPALEFLPSVFLTEAEALAMAAEVERLKAKPPKRRTKGSSARLHDDILDECEQSFLAAQEKVAKAAKNYYAETALMALLCRHDRVLWVVNMTTAGERQFYALALLRKLASELPADWLIGLLYDIGCQLSRSIEKWSLLPELSDRLVFAVSVFHAYGHQWECQVVFHPRKCEGFGLTDGEGCERFWSSIRHLIACLRVSGFHRRLFVLDRQMEALTHAGLWKIGVWLRRKQLNAQRQLTEARGAIRGRGISRGELRRQWKEQVDAQLAKPARKSANAGEKAIDEILVALGTVQDLKEELRDHRKDLRKAHALTAKDTQAIETSIESARHRLEATESRIVSLHASLGTEHCRRLEEMRSNAYICARVNARAMRASIRQSLVKHKFEHRKVERAYRHQVLEARVHAQTKDVIHRRERGISAQVAKYNSYVAQMKTLAAQGKKPRGRAPLPRKLDAKKLFKLDVDDDIWQEDPGLGPQDEANLPRWQTDEDVKQGIVALLLEDRCIEELERLDAEVDAVAAWWKEEEARMWAFCADSSVPAHLRSAVQLRLDTHVLLKQVWKRQLQPCDLALRFAAAVDSAGPHDIADAAPDVDSADPEDVDAAPDVDSDDASDAHSEIADEDEPVVEVLDELLHEADANALHDSEQPSGSPSNPESTENIARVPSAGKLVPAIYRAGNFTCRDEDLDRMSSRTTWLSGDGLSVFVRHQLQRLGKKDVSVLHSRVLWDVNCYVNARLQADTPQGVQENNKRVIFTVLSQLVPPAQAQKWLILGHVPAHWTLLEIRWQDKSIRFYDSYSGAGGYTVQLEKSVRALLDLCGEFYGGDIKATAFQWIGEQRDPRQTNTWDCGAFVAADAVSLIASNEPSRKLQSEMGDWRAYMASTVRSLKGVEDEQRPGTSAGNGPTCVIDLVDSDEG